VRQHCFEVARHFAVAKTGHKIARTDQEFGSQLISLNLLVVHRPIEFDHEAKRRATEIKNERTDRMLPSKLQPPKPSIS
jgi:hypothetical protein